MRISKSTSPSGSKSGRDQVDDGNSPVASRLFVLSRSASGFINAQDSDGRTPLHYAATADVAEFLISNGADTGKYNLKKCK